jgi:hypothetical protein
MARVASATRRISLLGIEPDIMQVNGQDAGCFAGAQKLERRRGTSATQFIHYINGRADGG